MPDVTPQWKSPAKPKRVKGFRRDKTKKVRDFDAELDSMRPFVLARSGGMCELQIPRHCLGQAPVGMVKIDDEEVPGAFNVHHRKDRRHGGTNELVNLLHPCGSGTTGCHGFVTGNPSISDANGWTVQSWAEPQKVPVVTMRKDRE